MGNEIFPRSCSQLLATWPHLRHNAPMQKIVILGLGYVGLPLARLLSKKKQYRVFGVDIDASKIRSLREEQRRSLIEFSSDFSKIAATDIVVVCVPTPVLKNHLPDYGPLRNACIEIERHMGKNKPLVIIESTINPGTCEEIVLPILEKNGLRHNKNFYLAHCPERIDPGSKRWNLRNIPRVVGGLDKEALSRAAVFYQSFIKAPVQKMKSLKTAEATKIVENTFRDINIAYVNELAKSFDELGIDIVDVLKGAGTKPFAFLPHYPGCGVGGHCIPVDPYYLIERARKSGFSHDFLKMARAVNHSMPAYTVMLLKKEMRKLGMKKNNVTVGLLGLAYKPNIGDVRESPALEILKILEKKKFKTVVYDPYVKNALSAESVVSFLAAADVIILATAHREFLALAPEDFVRAGVKLIIDGRNVLPKDKMQKAGLAYKGIGH